MVEMVRVEGKGSNRLIAACLYKRQLCARHTATERAPPERLRGRWHALPGVCAVSRAPMGVHGAWAGAVGAGRESIESAIAIS